MEANVARHGVATGFGRDRATEGSEDLSVGARERLTAVIVVRSFQTSGLAAATVASAYPISVPPGVASFTEKA